MTILTELKYTDKYALIKQIGFFGKHTCSVVIPLDKIDLIANTLSDMYFKWLSQVTNLTEYKHLYYELKLDANQTIEIEEGIGNLRNRDTDGFALYDVYGEKILNDFYHNTVVFSMQNSLILSGLLKNKESFIWEQEK